MPICSRWILVVSLLLLTAGSSAIGQQSKASDAPALNYGFVSPNTRNDLKLTDAVHAMNSPEESDLLRNARNLSCVVKRRIFTRRALGSWNDGAEHSILLRIHSDESTIRYLLSRLGRDANQKAVIYFHPYESGTAKIYTLNLQRRFSNFLSITRVLDQTGIAFRTLVPAKQKTIVYVVDTESNLGEKIKAAARRLKARLAIQSGTSSFIGDDSDREKGQSVFAKEINDYEAKHPDLPLPCAANSQ